MSVQAVNQLLGPGQLFIKRKATGSVTTDDADGKYRLIGSVKEATLTITKEETEQKPGDMLMATRRDKVEEKAQLKCKVVDFRLDQMINALGLSITRSALTVTSSFRIMEEITFGSTTSTSTLSRTPISATSVDIVSADRGTDFVKATDYTIPAARSVAPKLAGFANRMNRVFYTIRQATAKTIRLGGNEILQNVSLMYVHSKSNGKKVAVLFGIATVVGEMSFEFREKDYVMPEITFAALGDPTQAKGRQLLRIIEEA